jgi:Uma2 family endonuclease
MNVAALKRMTVPEFVAWAEHQPKGRYELVHGLPVAMAPQRSEHAKTKFLVALALRTAILRAGLPCHVMPDGMSVRVDDETVYEPDALVYCGPEVPDGTIFIDNPVIVVEVISPSSEAVDTGDKLIGYFRVPSVAHYLIVHPLQRVVTHHARGAGDLIETRIKADGELRLDPPGLSLPVVELLPAA